MPKEKLEIVIDVDDKASKKMGGLQKVLSGVAVAGVGALAGGLAASVKRAADFESAMARVGALSGAGSEGLQEMTDAAKELGETTRFTASEAAEGMQFLAMAGFETNQVIEAMPGLLATAAAGQTDLATTSDIVSNILSGFGIDASETARVADILTATFTGSNTTLESLGNTLKFVAPVAADMGFELTDVAAAVGKMGDAGIQGSMAGTSLRAAMIKLAAPTTAAKELMDELGLSVADGRGNMLGLPDILGNVNNALGGMSEAQRAGALQTLVGTEAIAGFSVLLQSTANNELPKLTESIEQSGGAAQQVADQQMDSLTGQMTLLGSAIDGVAIDVGNALLPMLTEMVSMFTEFIGVMKEKAGPAMLLINDALTRMAAVFGSTGEEITAGEVVLWAFEKVLSAIVTAVELIALGFQIVAGGLENFKIGFDGIVSALETMIKWSDDAWVSLEQWSGLDLGIFTPGSPTPFENGLRGIIDALGTLSSVATPVLGALSSVMGGSAGDEQQAGAAGQMAQTVNPALSAAATGTDAWISRTNMLNSTLQQTQQELQRIIELSSQAQSAANSARAARARLGAPVAL